MLERSRTRSPHLGEVRRPARRPVALALRPPEPAVSVRLVLFVVALVLLSLTAAARGV